MIKKLTVLLLVGICSVAIGQPTGKQDPGFTVCFEEGTSQDYIEQIMSTSPARFTFTDNRRWSTTANTPGPLSQGDPMIITWSIIPDGTPIAGYNGEPAGNSNLISFLNGIYGNQDTWLALFEQIFARWSDLNGVTYVFEPNDDGAPFDGNFPSNPGSAGVRGDIRIGGHTIDGDSNILAYNFFPDSGDMIIDTADNFYANTSNNSLGFRNVLAHEHGHGMGISHVCPVTQTKLMEPFVSFAFDGPQHDDILAAQRGYGDRFEHNDNVGEATDLGTPIRGNSVTQSDLSIDGTSDVDYFQFTISSSSEVTIEVAPQGQSYLSGPQNFNGTCSAGTTFNSLTQSDLSVELLDINGSTVLDSADANGAGGTETISSFSLNTAGTYYVRVQGDTDAVQLYDLQLDFVPIVVNCSFEELIPFWQGSPAGCSGMVPNILDLVAAILNEQQPKRVLNQQSYLK